ncbi:hypothetical protein DH2020_006202 [Rehmannia glutinosa]|uniref:DUF4283 domain-containing protein n=1 Tax=Rehmannia glutinosa TaxID=99300 RepID=A0ABR0XIL6_REHGL
MHFNRRIKSRSRSRLVSLCLLVALLIFLLFRLLLNRQIRIRKLLMGGMRGKLRTIICSATPQLDGFAIYFGKTERLQVVFGGKNEISLEERDIVCSREDCEKGLIGKIFGEKKINFTGLKNTVPSIWITRESFVVREIGLNLFQFVFKSQEDKSKVLKGKTWSFENQYLLLREWSENILKNIEEINSVELWTQIWNVPQHWISLETGMKIGQKFGGSQDILIPETGSIRGQHIKMLVEINLDKPLVRGTFIKLDLKSCWVDFRYKNLQNFCFYYGKVGHLERNCGLRKEYIKHNSLQEGQFGKWLRASEPLISRMGNRDWKKESPKKMSKERKGTESDLDNEVQKENQRSPIVSGNLGCSSGSSKSIELASVPIQKETQRCISGPESSKISNLGMGDQERQLESSDQAKEPATGKENQVLVEANILKDKKRTPLEEIQNFPQETLQTGKKQVKPGSRLVRKTEVNSSEMMLVDCSHIRVRMYRFGILKRVENSLLALPISS